MGITGIVITDKVGIGDYRSSTQTQHWLGRKLGSTVCRITRHINSVPVERLADTAVRLGRGIEDYRLQKADGIYRSDVGDYR